MWRPPRIVIACGFLAVLLAIGCRNQTAPIPNPLTTADRVPPPGLRTAPGAAQPYYTPSVPPYGAGPTTFAPAPTPAAPGGFAPAPAQAPPFAPPTTTIPPGQAAPVYAPPVGGSTAPPFGGGSASRPMDRSRQLAGDTITVQPDAGALRFSSDPGPNRGAIPRSATTALANSTPRPATASGWIAGSAPVRPASDAGQRVRLPGASREPVSVAALDRGVPVAPLERAPTGARPGEPAPLRVATPPSTTGWR